MFEGTIYFASEHVLSQLGLLESFHERLGCRIEMTYRPCDDLHSLVRTAIWCQIPDAWQRQVSSQDSVNGIRRIWREVLQPTAWLPFIQAADDCNYDELVRLFTCEFDRWPMLPT